MIITANMAEGVPDVDIDTDGRFKYILIKVTDKTQGGAFKHIVRGFDWANYHGKLTDRPL